jgi:ABC-type glycerol-3-phosphate transport system substrate-binding protein
MSGRTGGAVDRDRIWPIWRRTLRMPGSQEDNGPMDGVLRRQLTRREVLAAGATAFAAVSVGAVIAACGPATTSSAPSAGASASGSTPSAAPSASAAGAAVEISWMVPPIFQYQFDGKTLQTDPADWPNQAAAAFQAENPNITVKPQVIPWDVWPQKRTAALTQGPLPDLMYRLTPDVVNQGLAEPVDDYLTPDDLGDIVPAATDAMRKNGRLYGVPWIGNPAVLVFNKTLADQKGASDLLPGADTPRDLFWPQYIELMKKVSGTDTYGLGVAAGHWSAVIGWMLGGWMQLWGANVWDSPDEERWVLHESDGAHKAAETYLQLAKDGLLVPGTPKWEDLDQLWYRNQLLSRGHWAAVDTELDAAVKSGAAAQPFELFYTQFPRADGVAAGVDHNYDGTMVMRNPDTAKRDAAAVFATWLARNVDAAVGIGGNGFFPIGHVGAEAANDATFASKPQYQWILNNALSIPAIPKSVSGPQNNAHSIKMWAKIEADKLYYATWESIVLGQRPPKDALNELGDRINKGLGAA